MRLDNEHSTVIGALALEDEVRPEARQAIEQLRTRGISKIVMITGDARTVAEAVISAWRVRSYPENAAYITGWDALIDAVSPDDVRATARRVLRPEALTFAIAGNPEGY